MTGALQNAQRTHAPEQCFPCQVSSLHPRKYSSLVVGVLISSDSGVFLITFYFHCFLLPWYIFQRQRCSLPHMLHLRVR